MEKLDLFKIKFSALCTELYYELYEMVDNTPHHFMDTQRGSGIGGVESGIALSDSEMVIGLAIRGGVLQMCIAPTSQRECYNWEQMLATPTWEDVTTYGTPQSTYQILSIAYDINKYKLSRVMERAGLRDTLYLNAEYFRREDGTLRIMSFYDKDGVRNYVSEDITDDCEIAYFLDSGYACETSKEMERQERIAEVLARQVHLR